MSELNVSFTPTLKRPVLIAAFRGWNDGGQGASLGAAYLAKQWGAALVAELGLEASRYEGPTGIVGIVHDGCREAGIASVSLWAAVPHYVSLAPSPRAALSLVRRFGDLMHVNIDLSELETAAEEYAEQVSEAVS